MQNPLLQHFWPGKLQEEQAKTACLRVDTKDSGLIKHNCCTCQTMRSNRVKVSITAMLSVSLWLNEHANSKQSQRLAANAAVRRSIAMPLSVSRH